MLWCVLWYVHLYTLQSRCGTRCGTRLGSHCSADVCDVVSGVVRVALRAVVCDVVGVCVRVSLSVCLPKQLGYLSFLPQPKQPSSQPAWIAEPSQPG